MVVSSAASVGEVCVAAVKPQTGSIASQCPSDCVSTADAERAADMARAVQARVGMLRVVRLARVEHAIRAGTYQPSASVVASRILDAAEIDAHLHATLVG